MPLFECEHCGIAENTALSNAWEAVCDKTPLLCSQCDPDIKRWHGKFERIPATKHRAEHPESWKSEVKRGTK